jgi:hypothetical protein
MKLFSFLGLLLLLTVAMHAQSTRVLEAYPHQSSIRIDSNRVEIMFDKDELLVKASTIKNQLQISKEDEIKMMAMLQFSKENIDSLNAQYANKFVGLSLANKLINRAQELKGINFENKSNNNLQVVSDAQNQSANGANINEDADYNPVVEESNGTKFKNSIWPWILAMLASFGIGFFVAKKSKPTAENLNAAKGNLASSDAKVAETIQQELDELKTKLQKLNLENINANTTIQQYLQGDKVLYMAVQEKLVAPYLQAIKDQSNAQIVNSSIIGMAHLIAIMRTKNKIWQPYDKFNFDQLLGNTADANFQNKIINSNTLPDEIPNDVKALLAVLQQNQASTSNTTSLFGYSIQK